jgi:Ca-activated chloride channel homolog
MARALWHWLALWGFLWLSLAGCEPRQPAAETTAGAASPAFTILAGSELKELESAIVQAGQTAGVTVQLSYAGTLDMVERINAGERFDALLPANGAYPALALATKPTARDKLFYSRMALGVKPAKLKALGWERQAPSWADIAQAAGKGQLRYAMSNASASNTGMSALFAVASASAGKTEDLTPEDVNPALIKAFLSGQKLTAGSSGWLADAFVKAPQALDGMVNYEAVILRANAQLPEAERLHLVYPRDGMISADYPLMLLQAQRRPDHDRLVAALKSPAFQRDVLGPAFLRPANPEVAANPALPTQAVAELAFPNRLEVIDAVLSSYQAQWRRPATSIFVLDVSGSMRGERLESMREALKVLSGVDAHTTQARLQAFQGRERVVLILFSTEVAEPQWVRFDPQQLDAARNQLRQLADGLAVEGVTAIYSALNRAQALAQAELQQDPERFVSIVLLTDGENNRGLSFSEFKARYPNGTPVRVFPILFGEANTAEMQALAAFTGGREFDGRSAKLTQVFRDIRGYQ